MKILGKCKTILSKHWPLAAASATFVLSCFMQASLKKPIIIISKQDSVITLNTTFLKLMAIGHRRMISDFVWIQTLLESDLDHYKKKDLNNWMYLRFNQISELDPFFYENYLYGGQFLAIIKDDLIGAEVLYNRGLKYFPDDFSLNYHSGFALYFEMGNLKEGLERFKKIQENPRSPQTLKFLIQKLQFETTHNFTSAIEFLLHNISITKDEGLKEKLKRDLYALKAERDLICLNKGLANCDKYDSNGQKYQEQRGKWVTKTRFKPYRIFKKKSLGRDQSLISP
jgi:hypothetical protein